MKGTVFIVVVLIIVFGYLLIKKDKVSPVNNTENVSDVSSGENDVSTNMPVIGDTDVNEVAVVKEFAVGGSNFDFTLNEMKVKKGDTVRIVFTNNEGFHDWKIDEFSASTKQIQSGKSETIEFVADKTGTFEYYCSVGNHRAQGMLGKLIVE